MEFLNRYSDKVTGMIGVKTVAVSLFVLLLSACTETGSWDFLRNFNDSLLARYSFDSIMNPGLDDSGNGFNGTLQNGALWVDDPVRGGVLRFDGVDDYMSIPTIAGGVPQLTFSVWTKTVGLSSRSAIYNADSYSPRGLHINLDVPGVTADIGFSIEGNIPENQLSAYGFVPGDLGQWFHIATVYDSSAQVVKFYVNGTLNHTETYTTAGNPKISAGWVGGWSGGSRWYDGYMDDLRFYSRTLSDTDIMAVYLANQ